jgi:hypothetical protein
MAGKGPLALVKEKFGDKQKLVEALEKLTADDLWVARTNKEKGLAHVSNAKLLRLHRLFTEVKEKFGTREKLIEALLGLENRAKDQGLRQRYSAWPVPRLYDAFRSASKRIAAAAKAGSDAKAPEPKKKAPAKEAAAKPAAAKAPAAKAAPAKAAAAAKAPAAKEEPAKAPEAKEPKPAKKSKGK